MCKQCELKLKWAEKWLDYFIDIVIAYSNCENKEEETHLRLAEIDATEEL